MSESIALTLEQQFSIKLLETRVQEMSHSEVQGSLIKLYQEMMMRENLYKHVLKTQWGINSAKQF